MGLGSVLIGLTFLNTMLIIVILSFVALTEMKVDPESKLEMQILTLGVMAGIVWCMQFLIREHMSQTSKTFKDGCVCDCHFMGNIPCVKCQCSELFI